MNDQVMTDPDMCFNCQHWGKELHPEDTPDAIIARRRCRRPRQIKETIEWRRPADWCSSHERKKNEQ